MSFFLENLLSKHISRFPVHESEYTKVYAKINGGKYFSFQIIIIDCLFRHQLNFMDCNFSCCFSPISTAYTFSLCLFIHLKTHSAFSLTKEREKSTTPSNFLLFFFAILKEKQETIRKHTGTLFYMKKQYSFLSTDIKVEFKLHSNKSHFQ